MKPLLLLSTVVLAGCVCSSLSAQLEGEVCGNGVDDDGDRFIDCSDEKCFLACTSGCLDLCAAADGDRCTTDGVPARCLRGASGCAELTPLTACAPELRCNAGACVAPGACTHTCALGATHCTLAGREERCVLGAAGCAEWSFPSPCAGGARCAPGSLACPVGPTDAGDPDGGRSDAGSSDGGATDSGTPDSGTADAGQSDGGPPDSGTPDAGPCPAGCTQPAAPTCVGSALRTFNASGTCEATGCSYGFTDRPCEAGCAAGACNACTPKSCTELNAQCGTVDAGCGISRDCGTCPSGSCGAVMPNRCGTVSQPCASYEDCTDPATVCDPNQGVCVPCGTAGAPCCVDWLNLVFVCTGQSGLVCGSHPGNQHLCCVDTGDGCCRQGGCGSTGECCKCPRNGLNGCVQPVFGCGGC